MQNNSNNQVLWYCWEKETTLMTISANLPSAKESVDKSAISCMPVFVHLMCSQSAPVYLHVHVWVPFPQCSRVNYKAEIWNYQESLLQAAALDLFPRTALFWKNHCIVIFLLVLWSPRRPTIAFPLALCSPRLPPLPPTSAQLGHARSPPLLPQSPASLLTSLCPFSPLTLNTNRWPTALAASLLSHDPLTSSCFSCWRRQLSKCLCEALLSFSLSPDQFPKWTLWHVLKCSRWRAK